MLIFNIAPLAVNISKADADLKNAKFQIHFNQNIL
jgi:hypothetical protein